MAFALTTLGHEGRSVADQVERAVKKITKQP